MKRIFALLLSLAVLFSCLAVTAGAMFDPSTVYDVKAQSAYIVNTDTNIIVYEKDSEKQVSAGGLTKYMTIALVLTNYADQLDSTFTMPFAISDYVHNSDNADMRSGETFTYREALYAMVTRNANEAAMGLAYELSGGDLAGWVSQMNTLSQRIGTTNSTWTDACQGKACQELCAAEPERGPEQDQRRQVLPQRHAGRHVRCDGLQERQRRSELCLVGQQGRGHLHLLHHAKPRHLR